MWTCFGPPAPAWNLGGVAHGYSSDGGWESTETGDSLELTGRQVTLAELVSSMFSESSCLKNKVESEWENIWHIPTQNISTSTQTHIHKYTENMYTHTYTNMYAYKHLYPQTCPHSSHMYTPTQTCTHSQIYTQICMYPHMHKYVYIQTCIPTNMYTSIHLHKCTHPQTCLPHIYTNMYTYTRVPINMYTYVHT